LEVYLEEKNKNKLIYELILVNEDYSFLEKV